MHLLMEIYSPDMVMMMALADAVPVAAPALPDATAGVDVHAAEEVSDRRWVRGEEDLPHRPIGIDLRSVADGNAGLRMRRRMRRRSAAPSRASAG